MTTSAVQRTLGRSTVLKGRGLFSGAPVAVSLSPAAVDTGILFRRTDLPGRPSARLGAGAVVSKGRFSAVRVGHGEVRAVEHLLGAVAGLEVDNLTVEVDAEELPCLDGSAAEFVAALRAAGIVAQGALAPAIELRREITVSCRNAFVKASPHPSGLRVSYTLDYGERFVGRQRFEIGLDEGSFVRDIAPARTYVLRPEVEGFLARGLGRGATAANTVVVEEDGSTAGPLRFPDECARHKVLDLVGDLRVLGGRLFAKVEGCRSGHQLNLRLAAEIHEHGAGP